MPGTEAARSFVCQSCGKVHAIIVPATTVICGCGGRRAGEIMPDPPRTGCWFCDGTGVTSQKSYDQASADGLERMAFKPGTRCMCTYSWAEISGSVAEILTEIADGKR